MTYLLSVIGGFFCIAAIIGATVPGMHFHVVFAGEEATYKFHKERVIRYETKQAQKEESPN